MVAKKEKPFELQGCSSQVLMLTELGVSRDWTPRKVDQTNLLGAVASTFKHGLEGF